MKSFGRRNQFDRGLRNNQFKLQKYNNYRPNFDFMRTKKIINLTQQWKAFKRTWNWQASAQIFTNYLQSIRDALEVCWGDSRTS